MNGLWSWVLEGVSFTGLALVGRKHWWAWLILLLNTVLWGWYGVVTAQWGFLVASCFYAPMYVRNLVRWFQTRGEGEATGSPAGVVGTPTRRGE